MEELIRDGFRMQHDLRLYDFYDLNGFTRDTMADVQLIPHSLICNVSIVFRSTMLREHSNGFRCSYIKFGMEVFKSTQPRTPPNASAPSTVLTPFYTSPGNMLYLFFLYLSPNVFRSALSLSRDQLAMYDMPMRMNSTTDHSLETRMTPIHAVISNM